jgi:hypothetical protein
VESVASQPLSKLDILGILLALKFFIFIPAMISAKTALYTTPTLFSPVMFKNWVALLVGVMDEGGGVVV